MLTDPQRILLSQLIDASWELKRERDTPSQGDALINLMTCINKVEAAEAKLKESMGLAEYEAFMNKGREMFKSKTV